MALRAQIPRRVLALGSLVTVLGLAMAATAPVGGTARFDGADGGQLGGGTLVLVGWAMLAWSVHRIGREAG